MALIDHVIVLAHLQPQVISGPPTESWEDTLRKLGMEEPLIALLPPAARQQRVGVAGEVVMSVSALDISPSGIVTQVGWPCTCGTPLHLHHELVLSAWAQHVAELEGIDPDHLERHVVQEIDGRWRPDGRPRVVCRCGDRFESPEHLPGPALALWEVHVRT